MQVKKRILCSDLENSHLLQKKTQAPHPSGLARLRRVSATSLILTQLLSVTGLLSTEHNIKVQCHKFVKCG